MPVDVRLDGAVRSVTIRRPPANALSRAEYASLRDAFTAPDGARVCLLRATGPSFCAGQDLDEFAALAAAERGGYLAEAGEAIVAAAASPVPLVAVVHGPAVGAGALLVTLADVVVMSHAAWLSFPEARLGLPLGLSLLERRVPPRLARQVMATGDRLPADRLHALGAVDHLLDAADEKTLREVADRVLGQLLDLPEPMAEWLYAGPDRAERARAYRTELTVAITDVSRAASS